MRCDRTAISRRMGAMLVRTERRFGRMRKSYAPISAISPPTNGTGIPRHCAPSCARSGPTDEIFAATRRTPALIVATHATTRAGRSGLVDQWISGLVGSWDGGNEGLLVTEPFAFHQPTNPLTHYFFTTAPVPATGRFACAALGPDPSNVPFDTICAASTVWMTCVMLFVVLFAAPPFSPPEIVTIFESASACAIIGTSCGSISI